MFFNVTFGTSGIYTHISVHMIVSFKQNIVTQVNREEKNLIKTEDLILSYFALQ